MNEEKRKYIKIIGVFLIILVLVVIVIALFILFNKDEKDTSTVQNTNTEIETSTITLNYTKNDECINYIDTLDELTYGNIAETDYSNTLYYTYYDEDYAYYLVCLTDLTVTIDDTETDLDDAIYTELITTEEFNNLLTQEGLTDYILLVPVDNGTKAVEETAEDILEY